MSDHEVSRRKVLAIVTNYGVEQDELIVPVDHLRGRGAQVDVAAVSKDPVETLVGDKDPGRTVQPDLTLDDADPSAYDLLLVPGGTLNADTLRTQSSANRIVRAFTAAGRPVAAICHGPWVLVEPGPSRASGSPPTRPCGPTSATPVASGPISRSSRMIRAAGRSSPHGIRTIWSRSSGRSTRRSPSRARPAPDLPACGGTIPGATPGRERRARRRRRPAG